ncbi:HNH endonuclease [Commensalibacter communis]|uniref:HNH endonuclease n=1 Tax=Commensalibacter communis TaxID=2972786 RepID=UPI0022FF7469|nr:HNH endonuclease [Commensalibacter communis]CAI3949998.1 unnamed protein product [Commensalibacter communis]CAI3956511.1 unnamed protein product [Commensalibacter communis]
MTRCIICDKEILEELKADTDAEKFCLNTNEHIIPNAIGGYKIVRDFICDGCNNDAGNKWDAKLSKSFAILCLIFKIQRQRGKNQPVECISSQGEVYYWSADNSLMKKNKVTLIKSTEDDSTIAYKLSSSDEKWLIKNIKNIEKRYKKIPLSNEENQELLDKHKQNVDIDYLQSSHSLDKPQYQSMVKTSLAYAYSIGVKKDYFDKTLSFLKLDDCSFVPFGSYDISDCIVNRPIGIPFHCVAIDADPQSKLLLGYVEYFGIYRYIIQLSDTYDGQKIHQSYAIDPTSAQEINLDVKFPLDQIVIQECLNNKYRSDKRLSKRFENMIKAFQLQPHLEEIKGIIRNTIFEEFVKNSKEDITKEKPEIFRNIALETQQFLLNSVLSEFKKEDIPEGQVNQYLTYYFFNEDENES